jgi:hypothetical protein
MHDYGKWLSERDRQHNMTNVIHFFDWFDKENPNGK